VLVLAMVVATCWGVVQLAALATPTRSVRGTTLLLAAGAGMYLCGVAAVAVQFVWTRAVAAATGDPVTGVVRRAGYTVDPFVEEIVKVLPLLVIGWRLRGRLQWGVTDHVLLGAASGAGFGLFEALLRFGARADGAVRVPEGWLLPVSITPPVVPDLGTSLGSWLPPPAAAGLLSLARGPDVNVHLVWSALAGLGVGLLLRGRGRVRLAGPALVLLAGADHAAHNHDLAGNAGGGFLGDAVTAPFVAAQPLLWLWPLVALAVAVVLDVRARRRVRAAADVPDLRLRREGDDPAANAAALAGYAGQGLPWTGVLVPRFVLLRRAAWYSAATGVTPAAEPLLRAVRDARDQFDAADSRDAWRRAGRTAVLGETGDRSAAGLLLRFWPLLLWALLLVPVVAYYLVGSTPFAAGVQEALGARGLFHMFLLLPAVLGLALLLRQLVSGIRVLPAVLRLPDAEAAAAVQLRLGIAAGATGLGVVLLGAWLRGTEPDGRVLTNLHVLDALSALLLAAGIALLIGAVIFFPPTMGLAPLATGAGTIFVPSVSGAFTTTALLGAGSIVLSHAASGAGDRVGGGGSGGGARPPSGGPGIPQRPPAPRPYARHWRLRNIVNNLWKGTRNTNRVGDGTTMDAIRNELRTGLPTHQRMHSAKGRIEIRALDRWIRNHGATATRQDRLLAWRLRAELRNALGGR
jgi:hypothetical protein